MGRSDRELGGDWRSMPKDEGDDDRRESSCKFGPWPVVFLVKTRVPY